MYDINNKCTYHINIVFYVKLISFVYLREHIAKKKKSSLSRCGSLKSKIKNQQ